MSEEVFFVTSVQHVLSLLLFITCRYFRCVNYSYSLLYNHFSAYFHSHNSLVLLRRVGWTVSCRPASLTSLEEDSFTVSDYDDDDVFALSLCCCVLVCFTLNLNRIQKIFASNPRSTEDDDVTGCL